MWAEIERIRTRTPNLFTEVSVRVVILFFVCILQFNVKPYLRHLNEAELYYYMKPRKDSFVPPGAMVVIVIFVPLILLCVTCMITKDIEDTTQSMLAWTMALTLNAFITESTKLIVGRPRPDYYYRCFPEGIQTVSCVGNMREVMEGRKSFPSGHSSFAFCSMGFLSVWMCGKLSVLSSNRGEGLRTIACMLPLALAAVIALSRCWDNHHHWEDVLFGSLLGFALSYFSYNHYYNPLESDLSGYSYLATETDFMLSNSVFSNDCSTMCALYDLRPNLFIKESNNVL